jgi:2-polyprenyl-6-methoxyphenol hydroxylase-like FAD-dependent oxidoreductase
MPSLTSVIVVGAGPTGLALAAELASAGVDCRVFDKRPVPSTHSRAFGLFPRTLELLELRGRGGAFTATGLPWARSSLGDGKRSLDFGSLDSPFPYMLVIPQNSTEEELATWAVESGAEIERGVAVTGLRQDADGVDVEVSGPNGPRIERADFVVGCDGVRSSVRQFAGISFQGSSYDSSLIVADVRLATPPDPLVYVRIARRGLVGFYPFRDGTFRMVALDHELMGVPVEEPVTIDELRESCMAILGTDFGLHDPLWMTRYRSEQRLSDRYRLGRVLLAGDAAHTHIPSGGQGLQTGIQDAMNLGWKLAAHLRGQAPAHLLDTYEQERRPIAEKTLHRTNLIYKFETSDSPGARLLRWLITRLTGLPQVQASLIEQLSGLTLRYPALPVTPGADHHRLVGRRLPNRALCSPDGVTSSLYEHFRSGGFVLLDQSRDGVCSGVAANGWADRIEVVQAACTDRTDLPTVVLTRPDGYIAWAGGSEGADALRDALEYWCGQPAMAGQPGE